MNFNCKSEIRKPEMILVHQPGEETRPAFEDPDLWGFDPSLKSDSRTFDRWLHDAQGEHQQMIAGMEEDGIEVVHLRDLLEQKLDELRVYIAKQCDIALGRAKKSDEFHRGDLPRPDRLISSAREIMLDKPVDGVIFGLENDPAFIVLPYDVRMNVYKVLGTLRPQASIYYTQDAVISTPAGLVKAKMAMRDRDQEPDIVEIALGKDQYVHKFANRTEGGDVTIYGNVAGGDIILNPSVSDGSEMWVSVGGQSGRGVIDELDRMAKIVGVQSVVKFFTPDFFDKKMAYSGGNVMHLDTIMMPVSEGEILGNRGMLDRTVVDDGSGSMRNALEWVLKNFQLVEVPDQEQQGVYGWGSNILPKGNRRILSSTHLIGTNANLTKAGFHIKEVDSSTLTSGFGSFHCMTAYLR